MSRTWSSLSRGRRQAVERRLRELGRPRPARRAPPPEGRLGADEQPAGRLREALDDLGPVFAEFGRYLSSRVDLLPRRDCLGLAAAGHGADTRALADVGAIVREQLGDVYERRFVAFDPSPRAVTRWIQQHDAWLATGDPVAVTVVRPDAERLLDTDIPLLNLLAPWLDAPRHDVLAAVDDFSLTWRRRLDQTHQAAALLRLREDAEAGGPLDAPRCLRDYCASGVLTTERVDGIALEDRITGKASPDAPAFDRDTVARQLAAAWLQQAVTGHVVPFDFDLCDLRLRDDRLVLVGGAFEPTTAAEGSRLMKYLAAAAIDDPDRALEWLTRGISGAHNEPPPALRRRLRQAVPFRDGEWSGDDRLAEQLLVHWRATREAVFVLQPYHVHTYRAIHAIAAATTRLSTDDDFLLDALHGERLRRNFADAQRLLQPPGLAAANRLLPELVDLPRRLDEILTLAADGCLRVKVQMPEAEERREARNRTVSLVASLVTLVALTFLVGRLEPALGADLQRVGAVLVLLVGGWLLAAAARL